MSKIRICYPYNGDIVGGSHISSVTMIKRLDRSRFEPLVLVRDPDGPIGDFLKGEGLDVEAMPGAGTISYRGENDARAKALLTALQTAYVNIGGIRPLTRFLKDRAVDIVHTNDGATHVSWALAAYLSGTKFIWHHRSPPTARGTRYLGWMADRILSVSDFAIPKRAFFAGPDKFEVVYSPFDLGGMTIDRAACRQEVLERLDVPPATHIVGFSGHFVVRKRPLAFVRAIAALKRQQPDLAFAAPMFGGEIEVSMAEVLSLAAELGVADEIRPLGFCPGGDRLIAGCDVLAVPAVNEPFGRTLIESMIVGTPVVAAHAGGNIEALDSGRTGFLVPPDDVEAMAGHLADLLLQPALRDKIVQAAHEDVTSRFGLDRHANRVMQIYDELLKPPLHADARSGAAALRGSQARR